MGRELLGAADVDDAHLAAMVADLLGEDAVELGDVQVDEVDYDLAAITTAGRWWVAGVAHTPHGNRPFRLFVKHIHNWSRSPEFAFVPPEAREMAARSVPWRTEAQIYRSDLAARLPDGLSMPRALAVIDLDESSCALWLEALPVHDWPWDLDRFERAAHLLGRLAGSARVAPLAQIDDHLWTVHDYLNGRLRHQVLPMLDDDGLWSHPLVAGAFDDDLRRRMRAAAAHVAGWVDELAGAPHVTGHGDACPNNLLGTARRDDLALIDFGFWKPLPVGFDLGQLLLGDVQLGRRGTADLATIDTAIQSAYVGGLLAEGYVVDATLVGRLHALQMAVFTGLSTVPFEHLGSDPTPQLHDLAATRAAIATFCLDLVDASTT